MRTVTIELPDVITINGATDAPDNLRNLNTSNFDADFCMTAMIHGISQKIGDTWSVSKKDVEKTTKVHQSLAAGDWTTKARTGQTAAKFDAQIAALNEEQLYAKLTPEQLSAIAAKFTAEKA